MSTVASTQLSSDIDPETAFYKRVLETLDRARVPFLVGGAFAMALYTGIERRTKDLDLFLRRRDFERASQVLRAAGYDTELAFPHWLGKVHAGSFCVDLIFDSGNGLTRVDDAWFEHAAEAEVLGVRAKVMPVEEMIASKAFIMERERYDGADVAHLLKASARRLDWTRLLARVGPHWRVLLSHLVLFGFVYPGERALIPAAVMDELLARLQRESDAAPANAKLCRGTLVSREQYLHDLQHDGYTDARLPPTGTMSEQDIAIWTAAIPERGADSRG